MPLVVAFNSPFSVLSFPHFGCVLFLHSSSESEMEEEEPPLPTSDLGGVPWKEAVRIHALLKGKSEGELEALESYELGDKEEDEDDEDDEDEDEEEEESSEGQKAAPSSASDPVRA